jgi:hypothetical protein
MGSSIRGPQRRHCALFLYGDLRLSQHLFATVPDAAVRRKLLSALRVKKIREAAGRENQDGIECNQLMLRRTRFTPHFRRIQESGTEGELASGARAIPEGLLARLGSNQAQLQPVAVEAAWEHCIFRFHGTIHQWL